MKMNLITSDVSYVKVCLCFFLNFHMWCGMKYK